MTHSNRSNQGKKRKPSGTPPQKGHSKKINMEDNSASGTQASFPTYLEGAPAWFKGYYTDITTKIDNLATVDQVTKLQDDLNTSLESTNKTVREQGDQITQLSEVVKKLEEQTHYLRNENMILTHKYNKLNEQINSMENQSRRDNLTFDGIKETTGENCELLVKQVMSKNMKCANASSIDLVRCHRIGSKSETQKGDRPIIAKFAKYSDRDTVWKSRSKLENSKIYVNENFSKLTESRRKVWYPVIKHAKTIPKYKGKGKIFIVVDKLYVEGRLYSVDEIDQLPNELQPAKISTPTKDGVTLFYGKNSPLSNHHKCEFAAESDKFNCVEQYLFYRKAVHAGDEVAAYRVMASQDPAEMKALGKRIKVPDQTMWGEIEQEVLTKGCRLKYEQNPHLKDFLLSTGDTVLGEANPHDSHWGTGHSLHDENAFKQAHWTGTNLMGKILMDLRAVFQQQNQSTDL